MMRHHDHFPPPSFFKLLIKPTQRLRMDSPSIRWTKPPVGWRHANATEIHHAGLRGNFRQNNVAVETEIRPESRAEENNITDFNGVFFQHMNIGANRNRFEFLGQLRNLLAVEFVISKHIDNLLLGKCFAYPLESIRAGMNVTCQHDYICIQLN